MSAEEELERARRDRGTPKERHDRATDARNQSSDARSHGHDSAGAWRGSNGGSR